jgi:asparagine synthase (glutamine-hydrolysing)
MCGIWAYIVKSPSDFVNNNVLPKTNTIKNRGPDSTSEKIKGNAHIVFHRLAINGLTESGDQPFHVVDDTGASIHIMCNGEIYNYKDIIQRYNITTESTSDCEVLCYLFQKFWNTPERIFEEIKGEYAIVAIRTRTDNIQEVCAARDPFGVRPLYWAQPKNSVLFSSLLSGIVDYGVGSHFMPGHFIQFSMEDINKNDSFNSLKPIRFYNLTQLLNPNLEPSDVPSAPEYYTITKKLISAVQTRLTSDREVGFLLSGGLDSSLVVGIAAGILGVSNAKTFSVGMEGSTDLAYARQVATFLGTDHTEVVFTVEMALEAIPEVIKCLETYDITTIRASIGSFLLAKHISTKTNVKVLLNGDGSDEVACGYLYNYLAPSAQEAHADAIRLLEEIHMYDGLRVDRTISYHGIEARVPFLDPSYVEAYMSLPAEWRVPNKEQDQMEKQFLRQAFYTMYPHILPKEVLFRRKEAFSDGVSAKNTGKETMIQRIKRWASEQGSDEPEVYKRIFSELYPGHLDIIPRYWMPSWTGNQTNDPSATTLNIY